MRLKCWKNCVKGNWRSKYEKRSNILKIKRGKLNTSKMWNSNKWKKSWNKWKHGDSSQWAVKVPRKSTLNYTEVNHEDKWLDAEQKCKNRRQNKLLVSCSWGKWKWEFQFKNSIFKIGQKKENNCGLRAFFRVQYNIRGNQFWCIELLPQLKCRWV